MRQELFEVRFPERDRFAHLGQIRISDVHLGDRAHRAFCPVGNYPEAMIEETLDDVRRHRQFRERRAKRSAQVMQRPVGDATRVIEFLFLLGPAVEIDRRLIANMFARGWDSGRWS